MIILRDKLNKVLNVSIVRHHPSLKHQWWDVMETHVYDTARQRAFILQLCACVVMHVPRVTFSLGLPGQRDAECDWMRGLKKIHQRVDRPCKSAPLIPLELFQYRSVGRFRFIKCPILIRIGYKIFENGTVIFISLSSVTRPHPPCSHPLQTRRDPLPVSDQVNPWNSDGWPVRPGLHTHKIRTQHVIPGPDLCYPDRYSLLDPKTQIK
jgi:hypothetical protein